MNFRKLSAGDTVDIRFNGSRVYGNDPYEMQNLRVVNTTSDTITLDSLTEGEFDVYFFENRWRYGSSAEVAKLLAVY